MKIDIVNTKKETVGALDLKDEIFGGRVNTDLIWESVTQENAAVNRALAQDALVQRLVELGMDVVRDSTPASAASFLRSETEKWAGIVRARNIRVN